MALITSIEQLEAIYGPTNEASLVKVSKEITPEYRTLIEASPFVILATAGPEGLDASPRGDERGRVVRIHDNKTLMMPDRRGNNRVDSLRNIVRDPRTAFLFLIPGSGTTLRVNGRSKAFPLMATHHARSLYSQSRKCSFSARAPSCAPNSGTRKTMLTQRAFLLPGRFLAA